MKILEVVSLCLQLVFTLVCFLACPSVCLFFFSICCCCCCFLLQKNTVDMSCQSQEETGGREKKDCCHANASGGTMLQRRGEREKGRMERRKESWSVEMEWEEKKVEERRVGWGASKEGYAVGVYWKHWPGQGWNQPPEDKTHLTVTNKPHPGSTARFNTHSRIERHGDRMPDHLPNTSLTTHPTFLCTLKSSFQTPC